jgi:hypothetical protein
VASPTGRCPILRERIAPARTESKTLAPDLTGTFPRGCHCPFRFCSKKWPREKNVGKRQAGCYSSTRSCRFIVYKPPSSEPMEGRQSCL